MVDIPVSFNCKAFIEKCFNSGDVKHTLEYFSEYLERCSVCNLYIRIIVEET